MLPIFVILSFETPGGFGIKPKIICAFFWEGSILKVRGGVWEFPFGARTCNNICADSADHSGVFLTRPTKEALFCQEVLLFPPSETRPTLFSILHKTRKCALHGGPPLALNQIQLIREALILRGTRRRVRGFYFHAVAVWIDIEGDRWAAQLSAGRPKL